MSATKGAHINTLSGDLLLGENKVSVTVPVTIKHSNQRHPGIFPDAHYLSAYTNPPTS
jgi:hypothetical protein